MPVFNLQIILEKVKSSLRNPLIRNMVIVGAVTLLIKVIAFYKETIIAGSFGLTEIIDTFMIAILVPSFIHSVFLNSLKNLFIPNYITELKQGGNKASFQAFIFIIVIAISLLSALLAYIFADFFLELIYYGQTESYYQLIKDQLYIILPCLIFWGISNVLAGLLEISNRFLIATISELFPLLTMILFLIFLKDSLGYMVLSIGTLVGTIIGFIFLLYFSIRYKELSLSKPVINDNSRLMIKQLPPKVSSSFLTALNNYIDQFFVAPLVVGSLGALTYGNKLPAFGVTIVIMALGSVLLPHFSRLVNEDLKAAYLYLFKVLKIVIGAGSVLILIAIFMSDWVVELWLERGEFTHEDTLKVSFIQKILLINVPFYLCTLIIVKFLTSINKNAFMAWISLFNLITNVVLNIILIKYYDVYGLAMSTSLVLIISSCFYFWYTYKQYKKIRL